jgi:hypothetical protein
MRAEERGPAVFSRGQRFEFNHSPGLLLRRPDRMIVYIFEIGPGDDPRG